MKAVHSSMKYTIIFLKKQNEKKLFKIKMSKNIIKFFFYLILSPASIFSNPLRFVFQFKEILISLFCVF
jgi:hypothetical protein